MKSWQILILMGLTLAWSVVVGFWLALAGAPQQAWLFCHVLEWCSK